MSDRFKDFADYIAGTGQDPNEPLTLKCWEDLQREYRRGRHTTQCGGYSPQPCDCGVTDRIEMEVDRLTAENARLLSALRPIARILSRVTPADDEREAFAQFFAVARGAEKETAEQKATASWLAERGQR